MFYNIVTLGCANVTPILGGWISNKYSYQVQFKILTAFTGVALLAIIFACPEHAYVRPSIYETDMASKDIFESTHQDKNPKVPSTSEARRTTTDGAETKPEPNETIIATSTSAEKPKTYWEELKP